MSRLSLICLHGFAQNGSVLANQLEPLAARLPSAIGLRFPNAPHVCPPESVARITAAFDLSRWSPPPHLRWWNAIDEGKVYEGWETSCAQLRALCEPGGRTGILGFSQGAIVAATLAALQERRGYPALAFVILIAGRTPRAETLRPLFDAPLQLPSLHIWGAQDTEAVKLGPQLVEAFHPATRQVVIGPGAHRVPEVGPAADAIIDWVSRYA